MAYTVQHATQSTIKGGINLYIELDRIVQEKHKNFSSQACSFLEVKLRRLQRETKEGKYDTRDKNLPTVLANANSSNHSRARCHNIEYK